MNRAILGAPFTSQSARIRCPNVCVTKEPNVLPPVTDDLVKPMLMFKAVIKYPATVRISQKPNSRNPNANHILNFVRSGELSI